MAKDYINHLQRDREKRIRETKALEEFIKTLEGGEAALTIWRQVSIPSNFLLFH